MTYVETDACAAGCDCPACDVERDLERERAACAATARRERYRRRVVEAAWDPTPAGTIERERAARGFRAACADVERVTE